MGQGKSFEALPVFGWLLRANKAHPHVANLALESFSRHPSRFEPALSANSVVEASVIRHSLKAIYHSSRDS